MNDYDNMHLDKKETIFSNLLWVLMVFAVIIFFKSAVNMTVAFEDESLKLMSLVFTLFFTMKLIFWVGPPTLIFKDDPLTTIGKRRR